MPLKPEIRKGIFDERSCTARHGEFDSSSFAPYFWLKPVSTLSTSEYLYDAKLRQILVSN